MDVDFDDDQYTFSLGGYSRAPTNRRATVLPIDEKHPFDLEGYLSSYTGTCHTLVLILIPVLTPPPYSHHLSRADDDIGNAAILAIGALGAFAYVRYTAQGRAVANKKTQ